MSADARGGAADRPPAQASASTGVAALRDAVALLRSEWSTTRSDNARLDALRELWPQVCALNAHVAERIGDIHVAGAAAADGFASTKAFLLRRLHLDPGPASRLMRVGTDMGYLAATVAATNLGEISVDHADAIRYVAADLGEQIMANGEIEQILLDYARSKTPSEVRHLGRLIKAHLSGDETAQERQVRLHEGRWLTTSTTFDGMVRLEAMLDPVAGAALMAAIQAYMPGPDPDGMRTPRQRRADALEEIVTVALANADRSLTGDEKPHLTVTVSLETLVHGRPEPHPDPEPEPDQTNTATGASTDGETRSKTGSGADSGARRRADLAALRPRSGTSTADAARAYLTGYLRPGGVPLLGPSHEPVSAETARRLACDAKIIPVVLGSRSEPLDIGRAARTVPLAMRRAVELRDVHCRFPGCDRPAKWCEVHHVRWWIRDQGPTEINNLVLACKWHHMVVHEYGWKLSFDPLTGTVTVTRPDGTPHDIVSIRDGPAP